MGTARTRDLKLESLLVLSLAPCHEIILNFLKIPSVAMNVWKCTSSAAASSLAEIGQEACIAGSPVWPNIATESKQQLKEGS